MDGQEGSLPENGQVGGCEHLEHGANAVNSETGEARGGTSSAHSGGPETEEQEYEEIVFTSP